MNKIPTRGDFVDREVLAKYTPELLAGHRVLFHITDIVNGQIEKKYNREISSYTYKYAPYIFATCPDGTKICIIVTGVKVFFDVLVNGVEASAGAADANKIDAFKSEIKRRLNMCKIPPHYTNIEIHQKYNPMKFQKHPSTYLRIYFDNLRERQIALDALNSIIVEAPDVEYRLIHRPLDRHAIVLYDRDKFDIRVEHVKRREKLYKTASDDKESDFINMFLREYDLNGAGWNKIVPTANATENNKVLPYRILTSADFATKRGEQEYQGINFDMCKYVISADISTISKVKNTIEQYVWGRMPYKLVMTWDIETYTHGPATGEVPKPEDTNFCIFMICATFHWYGDTKPLLKVCLVDVPSMDSESMHNLALLRGGTTPIAACKTDFEETPASAFIDDSCSEKFHLVVCGNESNLLMNFARLIGKLAPDIVVGFNNGSFDAPILESRIALHDLRNEFFDACSCIQRDSIYFRNGHADLLKAEYIKISADENVTIKRLSIPGMLETDCMRVFQKIYPRTEVGRAASLNFYLKTSKLPLKEDMPYTRMFGIYANALALATTPMPKSIDKNAYPIDSIEYRKLQNLEEMFAVARYCVGDAWSCQRLYVKQNVVDDKAAMANTSYVTFYNAFYRADGVKVRNLVAFVCKQRNYAFSNITIEEETRTKTRYEGGHVFMPITGLNKRSPVTGLDASSLYPSIMMTKNFSPEKIIDGPDADTIAEEMRAAGYTLDKIEFEQFIAEKGIDRKPANIISHGYVVRHNGVIRGDEPHIILGYAGLTCDKCGWGVDPAVNTPKVCCIVKYNDTHTADDIICDDELLISDVRLARRSGARVPVYGRAPLPGESMGICPYILTMLVSERKKYKNLYVAHCLLIEALHAGTIPDFKQLVTCGVLPEGSARNDYDTFIAEGKHLQINISDLEYMKNKLNLKQLALKVHMNTFYGECGNSRSTLYKLLVAGGITSYGRHTIKKVASFVIKQGFKVWYGDTDSLYLSCPERCFSAIREKYDELAKTDLIVREQYWKELVCITRDNITTLRDNVNDYLVATNCSEYLAFAYEEVLFPIFLAGKKRYAGVKHEQTENFHPSHSELFIRGLDFIKQGKSDLARNIGYSALSRFLSLESTDEPVNIVLDEIRKYLTTSWDISNYILYDKYKPNKQNIKVLDFIARVNKQRTILDQLMSHLRDKTTGIPLPGVERQYELYAKINAAYECPQPGEKFQYVIVNQHNLFDIRGMRIKDNVGARMEFLTVYKLCEEVFTPGSPLGEEMAALCVHWPGVTRPFAIDKMHYLDTQILSILGRFLSYIPEFFPPEHADLDDRKYDDFVMKNVKQFLTVEVNKIMNIDSKQITAMGHTYKKIYKSVQKATQNIIVQKTGVCAGATLIADLIYDPATFSDPSGEKIDDSEIILRNTLMLIQDRAEKTAVTLFKHRSIKSENDNKVTFGNAYVTHLKSILGTSNMMYMKNMYQEPRDSSRSKYNEMRVRFSYLDNKELELNEKLKNLSANVTRLLIAKDMQLTDFIHETRGIHNVVTDVDTLSDLLDDALDVNNAELETLEKLDQIYRNLISIKLYRLQLKSIIDAFKEYVCDIQGYAEPITPVQRSVNFSTSSPMSDDVRALISRRMTFR